MLYIQYTVQLSFSPCSLPPFMLFLQIAGGVATAIFVYFSPSEELMHPIQFIFICYTLFGAILFMTLGWTIVVMIGILSKRTYLIVAENENFSHCYSLIVQLINNLNNSFGLCLLMALVFYFIWLINGLFFAMVGLRERGLLDQTSLIIIFLEVTVFPVFFLFLYIPHRIIQEVQLVCC